MWSDSESTLKMIYDQTSRCLFFSNRLSKEHAASKINEWRYVESENNPADFTSRGIDADDTESWEIFHYGPKFLYKEETEWPKTNIFRSPSSHVFATTVAASPSNSERFLINACSNVSTWHGKLKRIAFVFKAARRWRAYVRARTRRARAELPSIDDIGRDSFEEAEKMIIRELQGKHFANEIETLKSNNVNAPNGHGN